MDLQRLESVIEEIREASLEQEDVSGLSAVIDNIKLAFESHWQENYMPFARNLQSKLSEGIPTPVLTVCGQGTREIRFTKYLAYFLDPSNDHGLGDAFLKSILGSFAAELPPGWLNECEVIPELWIGDYINEKGKRFGCFCDIGILGRNYVVIIEQKILSGEDTGSKAGLRQLQRYSVVLANNPKFIDKRVIKIYLTPTGKLPKHAQGWMALAYNDLIDSGYRLLKTSMLSVTAKENLRSLLLDLVLGPFEDAEDIISEVKYLTKSLLSSGYNLRDILRFSSISEDNRMLLNIVMEG